MRVLCCISRRRCTAAEPSQRVRFHDSRMRHVIENALVKARRPKHRSPRRGRPPSVVALVQPMSPRWRSLRLAAFKGPRVWHCSSLRALHLSIQAQAPSTGPKHKQGRFHLRGAVIGWARVLSQCQSGTVRTVHGGATTLQRNDAATQCDATMPRRPRSDATGPCRGAHAAMRRDAKGRPRDAPRRNAPTQRRDAPTHRRDAPTQRRDAPP
jgi:hypothetical protein